MATLKDNPITNRAIASARDLPSLISNLQQADPSLATQLLSKPLLLSKSPPAILLATGIAWASTKLGLGWDDTTCGLVSGSVLLLVAYLMRMITKQPVAGIVATPAGTPSAIPGAVPTIVPVILLLMCLGALGACANSALATMFGATATAASTPGQLFCNIAKSDGTSAIEAVVDTMGVPVVVTDIAAFVVADECHSAAVVAGATAGVPVPPPAGAVSAVAITPPAQTPAVSTT